MLKKIKERFTLSIINSLLNDYEAQELHAGKRIVSIIAGVYIFQKGIRCITKTPIIAIEEVALGGVLLYTAFSGLNGKIIKKPINPSDIRRNQIQGNDPNSTVPAFV
ncbi:hypothetical protein [Pedobacter sp. MC2016-24]|uniref:hypothetical protein n=1 Tax=Pedobacter sp. MC2016-24 TaxID=2780090 RepID=UPI00187EC047|nr:hypothetical protein [Pedobacter sp. MC2016-24]MBE9597687.1 hypothetical protein [Pedobacter sp. MC2016-24]